jgi:molybdopterin synthase catalytic subunit
MTEIFALVTDQVLNPATYEDFVTTEADGAVVTFRGVIRNHDHGSPVLWLEYQAHPEAERFLAECLTEVAERTGVRLAAGHRYGPLAIGDVALIASAASAHRAEAFAACADLVELIKQRIPIWKRQHLFDGTTEWVGLDA